MQTTVTVSAIKAFEHGSRSFSPGDAVVVTPIDAIALAQRRLVTLTKLKPKQRLAPEPEPLRGGIVIEETVETIDPVEPDPVPKKTRRGSYKRRDLQVEELTPLAEPAID